MLRALHYNTAQLRPNQWSYTRSQLINRYFYWVIELSLMCFKIFFILELRTSISKQEIKNNAVPCRGGKVFE